MAPTVCEMKVVAMSTSPQNVAVSAQMPKPSVALSIACALAQASQHCSICPSKHST